MLLLLPQALVDGLLIGGIYITIAIGFSLAYGVMHIIDFAVGVGNGSCWALSWAST